MTLCGACGSVPIKPTPRIVLCWHFKIHNYDGIRFGGIQSLRKRTVQIQIIVGVIQRNSAYIRNRIDRKSIQLKRNFSKSIHLRFNRQLSSVSKFFLREIQRINADIIMLNMDTVLNGTCGQSNRRLVRFTHSAVMAG